jgi:predicted dehydrogenase
LRFAGGGIANVTASRVSIKRERKMRLFQRDTYLTIDLGERSIRIARRAPGQTGLAGVEWEQIDLGEGDALAAEIAAFAASVRTRARPAVTGEDGLAALELCEQILSVLESE